MEVGGATFSNIPANPHSGSTSGGFGLGDAVYAVTQALGIPHCASCDKRRQYFNRLLQLSRAGDPLQRYILLRNLQKDTDEIQ